MVGRGEGRRAIRNALRPELGASRLPAEGRAATGVVNNYSLHIDGARSASMTRGQERLVAEIFDEFGLAFDMGVI